MIDRIDWHEARRTSFDAASPLGVENVAVAAAAGRRIVVDARALTDLPHYASSAMDGWAVAGPGPWRLTGERILRAGQAIPVVTGGEIPDGATAVLKSEDGVLTDDATGGVSLSSRDSVREGAHIRRAGEEALAGQALIDSGTLLNPAHLALAAVGGYDVLSVARRPRIGLVLTGSEVVAHGRPAAGEVRDAFSPMLPPFLASLGGDVVSVWHVEDSLARIVESITADAEASDVVITTGGTGFSTSDLLHQALAQCGAELLIDGIAARPGGPTLLAKLRDGRFLIGLPGNPLAAMMGLITIGEPLIARLSSGSFADLVSVTSAESIAGREGLSMLVPFEIHDGVAVPSPHRGAAMLRGLAGSSGVAVIPSAGTVSGEVMSALMLPWAGKQHPTAESMR